MSGVGLAMAALLAASLPGGYDCQIGQTAVITENGVLSGEPDQFPEALGPAWRFGLNVRELANAALEVEVRWPPASLVEIGGTYPAQELAPGHIAFAGSTRGGCLFGGTHCPFLVQLAAREDGSLGFTIMPTGLNRTRSGGFTQFNIIFTGSCRRQNGS